MSCLDIICRVCLSADIKMYSVLNTPLQVIYEGLTRYKLIREDGRPETVCFICFSQLQTCFRFKKKSQKSEEILAQLFQNGIEILQETVAILNKGIKHDFAVTTIETFDRPKLLTVKKEKATSDEEKPVKANIDDAKTEQSEAGLCRVCLAGVKTYSIKDTSLQTIYEKLTNTKLTIQGRPETVCCICRCQLLKCIKFVNKAKRSEKILTELIRNGVQLSRETLVTLNSKIKSHLEVAPTESLSCYAYGQFCTVNLSKDNILSKSYTGLENEDEEKKKQYEVFEQPHFTYECGVCIYKCMGLSRYKNHLRLHALYRPSACDICFQRYPSHNHLKRHMEAVHSVVYKCPKCPEKFKKKSKFNLHMNIHTELVVYECDFCRKVFKNKRYLKEHDRKVHGGYKYQCDRCDQSFANELRWKLHVIDVHGSDFPYYTCDHCRKQFKMKYQLVKHIRNTHPDVKNYKCEVCDKFFKIKSSLQSHLKVHLEKSYKCDFCSKTFRSKYNLATHLKYHLNQKDFICEVCAKGFVDRSALKAHSRVHTQERYTCQVCNAKFLRKYFYDEHIDQHTNGFRKYMCNECGKIYPLQAQLKLHMYRHKRPKFQQKIEKCKICQKETKSLKLHMRIHDGSKPYSCEICDKKFRSSSNMAAHRNSHYGLKKYGCDECGKFFAKKYYLKIHITSHSSAKTYKCDECNASYSHKAKLSFHKRKHWKVYNFRCEQCGKKFSEKRSLDFHRRTHTKITKFICDYCYMVHLNKTDLINHIKSHRRGKLKCEVCKKSFGKMKALAGHMKQHMQDKSVCPLCKDVVDRLMLRRHYHMLHNSVMPYACNVCEEGSTIIEKVYSHYMECHSKADRFVCDLCCIVFTRGGGLRKHMKRKHNNII